MRRRNYPRTSVQDIPVVRAGDKKTVHWFYGADLAELGRRTHFTVRTLISDLEQGYGGTWRHFREAETLAGSELVNKRYVLEFKSRNSFD